MKLSQSLIVQVKRDIVRHFRSLKAEKRVNLRLYDEVLNAGEAIRAFNQEVVLPRNTACVLADLAPQCNWAHACEWCLHDADTGELYQKVKASFPPPQMWRRPQSVELFHAPVRPLDTQARRARRRTGTVPRLNTLANHPGQRYAILYSGESEQRHLNDLEFLYRTLINVYAFSPANIHVLNHDGTINYNGAPTPIGDWPSNTATYHSPYQIVVNGQGTRADFQATFATLAGQIRPEDLLFIHTNNHGAGPCDSGVNDYCMCAYASGWAGYFVNDFVADLSVLPGFEVLMVMMEQCRSGGFINPIINNSPARWTHVATAVQAKDYSLGGKYFDPFTEDWIAGIARQNWDSSGLAQAVDTNGDSRISAAEVFAYADAVHLYNGYVDGTCPTPGVATCQTCGGVGGHTRNYGDTPRQGESPAGAGAWIFLGQPAHDLFLRDNLEDHGREPLIGGGISCSPDIIVYSQQLLDPEATLLTPAAQDNDMLGEPIEFGQDNFIYLRVQNRGLQSTSGKAKLYWTLPSALPTPASWHYLGETDIPAVPSGEMIVAGPVKWAKADIPVPNHYCFVGLIQSGDDPAPDKDAIHTLDDFYRLIRESNNATWKNFDVHDVFANSVNSLEFHIQGWPRIKLSADLLIDLSAVPTEMETRLRILKRLSAPASLENMELVEESERYQNFQVQSGTCAYLCGIALKPSDDTQAWLEVVIPEDFPNGVYRLGVAQIVDGREMGRVTRVLAVGDYPFLANSNSEEVHVATCVWAHAVGPSHKVAYKDLEHALNHGYNGCRYCLPEYSTD
jgi:hypothetical protein